jgi:DnaJ-domain-containing protein 1
MNPSSATLSAAYCPVWSFTLNLRFVVTDSTTGRQRLDYKPRVLAAAYGRQSVVHLPGLAAYAGYSYRRSLLNAVHNTTLVFLGDETVPFGPWMLRPMEYMVDGSKTPLQINPDPWNATRRQALSVVRDEWQALAADEYRQDFASDLAEGDVPKIDVQMQVIDSRRVYLPTYLVEYSVLGIAYQAFVSGADTGAPVAGVSHQLWTYPSREQADAFRQSSQSIIGQAFAALQSSTRILGPRNAGLILISILQVAGSVLGRLLLRIPVIAAGAALFVGLRKVVLPWWTDRTAAAEWVREREAETKAHRDAAAHLATDDFVDTTGTAARFYQRNRATILRALSGQDTHQDGPHETGDYDWYADWTEWARRVYEQEQQQHQQQQSYQQQQQQQSSRTQRTRSKPEYQWDFDHNDPYSVLKIPRTATSQEISQAFRREMLKYHPDTQTNATAAEKNRATERSKFISQAYQTLKKKK